MSNNGSGNSAAMEAKSITRKDRYEVFFENIVDAALKSGENCITLRSSNGDKMLGDSSGKSSDLVLEVWDNNFFRRVITAGNLGMGEAYMERQFDVPNGKLPELLACLLKSRVDKTIRASVGASIRYAMMLSANSLASLKKNVRRHYDIGDSVFDVFLEDEYMVYSCGYARSHDDSIDDLQSQKIDRICKKLKLFDGATLLDVGCGNGGLLVHAAKHYGIRGIGITNSTSHAARAKEHAKRHGVEDQLNIILGDFSEIQGPFDRIVSVGMLEHVPSYAYKKYFQIIKTALEPDGWALVHAIGKNARVNRHDPFIQKYIFPGSDTPKLSDLATQIESMDMAIIDVENMVRHYAVTTRRWLDAFNRNKEKLDPSLYDPPFKRMWEYYLSCGIAVALAGDLSVYQVLFTKDYHSMYDYQRV